jgi:hypothetical protein
MVATFGCTVLADLDDAPALDLAGPDRTVAGGRRMALQGPCVGAGTTSRRWRPR